MWKRFHTGPDHIVITRRYNYFLNGLNKTYKNSVVPMQCWCLKDEQNPGTTGEVFQSFTVVVHFLREMINGEGKQWFLKTYLN